MPQVTAAVWHRAGRRFTAALHLLVVAAVVVGAAAPDVAALSIRRTWRAALSGGHGSATLVSYSNGIGQLRIDGSGFPPLASLPVILFEGSCSRPRVLVRFRPVNTSASGTVARVMPIGPTDLHKIRSAARTGRVGLRIGGSRGPAACGWLTHDVATRVAIPKLGIDLPVIRQPAGYPRCNVAMHWAAASQPREAGVTFIYAHAQKGMFLPLLTASKARNGAGLIGLAVYVWTSDSALSTYRITEVRRHQRTFGKMLSITREELWLETSEGPRGTPGRVVVVARRVSSVASSYAAAHPRARPVVCG
jgi:sortase (surface protein transpeptidase)